MAIDPTNPANWYVNNGAGVSIHLCSKAAPARRPISVLPRSYSNANVANDGLTMTRSGSIPRRPAGFDAAVDRDVPAVARTRQRDRLDCSECGGPCWMGTGPAVLQRRCADPIHGGAGVTGGGEVVYVGIYGLLDGGATLAGHVLSATMNANGTWSAWKDLTLNPVLNDQMVQ